MRPTRVAAVSCQDVSPGLNQCKSIAPCFLSVGRSPEDSPWGVEATTYKSPKIRRGISPWCRYALYTRATKVATMPLEGHWKRTNTPLRRLTRRERRVAIVSAGGGLLTGLAPVLAPGGDSRPGAQ